MTDVSELFSTNKPYATAADHEGITQQSVIEQVGTDEYNGEHFAWVKLACVDKPIRLNKTNGRELCKFGTDNSQWIGKNVFVTTANGTMDNGKAWVGWRLNAIVQGAIQKAAETAQSPTPAAPFNDDIPFY